MTNQCEACGLPVNVDEHLSFFDYNQQKDVLYHRECYAEKFNAPHALKEDAA